MKAAVIIGVISGIDSIATIGNLSMALKKFGGKEISN